jgi:PEP-CTERM motif-containing protein
MKKWLRWSLLAGAMSSYAQDAEVNFNNNTLTQPPDRLVRVGGTVAPLTGTNWSAVLLYGTSASSLTPHPSPARFRVTTTSQPGTWNGGVRTLTGIPNTPNTQVAMRVAVFDNTRFANYAAALAAGGIFGVSAVFTYTVPTPPLGPTSLDMVNFGGFTIVPEPSVIGLGLVGAAALFMLRRRKAS